MPKRISTSMLCLFRQKKRILQLIIRSKFSKLILLSTSLFLLISISSEIIYDAFHDYSNVCNDSKEVTVPGQIRKVRIHTNRTLQRKMHRKTILLWTTYFSEEYSSDFYFFQSGQETFDRFDCQFRDCSVTTNKSLLPYVDAVLFHARDINFEIVPKRNRTDQIWILYCMEPPKYVLLKWNIVKSMFNWTMTYRSDSDIPVKYGEVYFYNGSCAMESTHIEVSQRPMGAIWLVSNCRTESRREAYVKELKKHFRVDIYGRCSRRRKCHPPQSESCYKLLENYKFYLSFENSICKDYVTEKFYNVLMYDIIPVVFGGANYTAIAPPNSFIDATEFPDPKDLADRLKAIESNTTWYNSFFVWKKSYRVHLHSWMCDLCRRLHEQSSETKTVPQDLWNWWTPGSSCRRWVKKKGFKKLF